MSSSTPSVPVSLLIGSKTSGGDGEPLKKTREDWRKAKELEEARKAGTAPAAVDEEGKDINPHIPQYISAAPWYYNTFGPTLKHQRPQDEQKNPVAKLDEWFHRGVNQTKIATKFVKGACENCGATTHKKKECVERPRRVPCRYSGAGIAPDEFIQPTLIQDFAGKRDRWNGYSSTEHAAIIAQFQKVEDAKRGLKAERLNTGVEDDNDDEDEQDGDEDKYVDEVDMPGTKVDSKQRITVRNLRIREDTAKYLRNLDPNSAYYDPKTRSMRDNPYKDMGKGSEEVEYAGENFVRFSGDTSKHAIAQMFAWEAQHAGVDVHLLAEPTKAEKLKVEYVSKKEEIKSSVAESILERYGGKEHLEAPPKALLLAQTEHYVEYSRSGKIIKGAEKPIVCSRYEEDVLINNHLQVWGSFWKDGQWGFQCCYSLIQNSYCTGESGKNVETEEEKLPLATATASSLVAAAIASHSPQQEEEEDDDDDDDPMKNMRKKVAPQKTQEELEQERESRIESEKRRQKKRDRKRKKKADRKKRKELKKKKQRSSSSSSGGSSSSEHSDSEDEELKKKKKVEKALKAEEQRLRKVKDLLNMDERKRPYNSMNAVEQAPDEAELEAYHMKRKRDEDPMAFFM